MIGIDQGLKRACCVVLDAALDRGIDGADVRTARAILDAADGLSDLTYSYVRRSWTGTGQEAQTIALSQVLDRVAFVARRRNDGDLYNAAKATSDLVDKYRPASYDDIRAGLDAADQLLENLGYDEPSLKKALENRGYTVGWWGNAARALQRAMVLLEDETLTSALSDERQVQLAAAKEELALLAASLQLDPRTPKVTDYTSTDGTTRQEAPGGMGKGDLDVIVNNSVNTPQPSPDEEKIAEETSPGTENRVEQADELLENVGYRQADQTDPDDYRAVTEGLNPTGPGSRPQHQVSKLFVNEWPHSKDGIPIQQPIPTGQNDQASVGITGNGTAQRPVRGITVKAEEQEKGGLDVNGEVSVKLKGNPEDVREAIGKAGDVSVKVKGDLGSVRRILHDKTPDTYASHVDKEGIGPEPRKPVVYNADGTITLPENRRLTKEVPFGWQQTDPTGGQWNRQKIEPELITGHDDVPRKDSRPTSDSGEAMLQEDRGWKDDAGPDGTEYSVQKASLVQKDAAGILQICEVIVLPDGSTVEDTPENRRQIALYGAPMPDDEGIPGKSHRAPLSTPLTAEHAATTQLRNEDAVTPRSKIEPGQGFDDGPGPSSGGVVRPMVNGQDANLRNETAQSVRKTFTDSPGNLGFGGQGASSPSARFFNDGPGKSEAEVRNVPTAPVADLDSPDLSEQGRVPVMGQQHKDREQEQAERDLAEQNWAGKRPKAGSTPANLNKDISPVGNPGGGTGPLIDPLTGPTHIIRPQDIRSRENVLPGDDSPQDAESSGGTVRHLQPAGAAPAGRFEPDVDSRGADVNHGNLSGQTSNPVSRKALNPLNLAQGDEDVRALGRQWRQLAEYTISDPSIRLAFIRREADGTEREVQLD